MRSVAPTRLGMEISQKISDVEKVKPAAGSWTTTMDQSCHTTKPRNSAKMDQYRLRFAMERPVDSHWSLFSASQLPIQRPGRKSRAGACAVRVEPGCGLAEVATLPWPGPASRSRALPAPAPSVRSTVTVYLLRGCCSSKVGTPRFAQSRRVLTGGDICLSVPLAWCEGGEGRTGM